MRFRRISIALQAGTYLFRMIDFVVSRPPKAVRCALVLGGVSCTRESCHVGDGRIWLTERLRGFLTAQALNVIHVILTYRFRLGAESGALVGAQRKRQMPCRHHTLSERGC